MESSNERIKAYDDKIITVLILSLLTNLFPIIAASTFVTGLRETAYYTGLVGFGFVFQTIMLMNFFMTRKSRVLDGKTVLLSVGLGISYVLPLVGASLFNWTPLHIYDLINVFIRSVAFFTLLCVPSRLSISDKGLERFMKSLVWLGIIACLYNLVANFNSILRIFYVTSAYSKNFMSFFLNKNSFAQFLFFGIVANTFLFMHRKSPFVFGVYILFLINLVATFSRGALAAVFIFGFLFFSLYYKRRILVYILLIGLLGTLVTAVLSSSILRDFTVNILIRSKVGTAGRTDLWQVGLDILNRSNWFFGVGEFAGVGLLKDAGYHNSQFHSFYIETLVFGGIFLAGYYLIIAGLVANWIRHIYCGDRKTGILLFSSSIALLFYAFFESVSFFSMGYVGTLFTIFYVTIPLLYANGVKLARDQNVFSPL